MKTRGSSITTRFLDSVLSPLFKSLGEKTNNIRSKKTKIDDQCLLRNFIEYLLNFRPLSEEKEGSESKNYFRYSSSSDFERTKLAPSQSVRLNFSPVISQLTIFLPPIVLLTNIDIKSDCKATSGVETPTSTSLFSLAFFFAILSGEHSSTWF